ncbi:hypothetical protein VNO80_33893 [Phaseolus coccineus]|uniref:Uncharacterized protein n=1 Tax=Phaseolus coccineus TaxID=3886 RepID=A0AAN9KYV3_PHACN
MPLNESNGPSTPSFDSDGRHRSHETRPLLLRKKPCLFPSLLGDSPSSPDLRAGRPGLSLLFCSRHEKDAQKRYAQRAEDPLRVLSRGGLSLLPDLERYYESSVPDSIAAAIWFTGTTKKSHAYVTTVTDGLSWTPVGRASGFHSHHHIDDQSPRALP